ncbi:GNAT family N-acetyltransferase [Halapricum salinum]|uniref:GNAT family N-acetyltransferase n=1 Tax=Halapricum salinum TaxID=1457250 RepID=A0A4D6HI87_9EURY|nr:GNAT family N-acetyltransferase [Halapricum salinum]QCC52732.1 GNAT family N-acetyltransferase [Halapricum salinum]
MEVTIRDADPEDETGLRILRGQALKAAFQDEYDRKTVGDLVATVDDDLSAWIDNDRSRVLVAETEITPVSYGVLDREHGELLSILTSPDYQREGFATQLLDRLETHAREHDVETLTATAPDVSRAFFEDLGFESVGDGEWYGLDAVVFEKLL